MFNFDFEFFKRVLISSFFGRRLVYNPFFLFVGTLLFMKKSAKVLRDSYSAPVWALGDTKPNRKCIVPAFFGERFIEKDGGLRTNNP
jgi:hypothetical protein